MTGTTLYSVSPLLGKFALLVRYEPDRKMLAKMLSFLCPRLEGMAIFFLSCACKCSHQHREKSQILILGKKGFTMILSRINQAFSKAVAKPRYLVAGVALAGLLLMPSFTDAHAADNPLGIPPAGITRLTAPRSNPTRTAPKSNPTRTASEPTKTAPKPTQTASEPTKTAPKSNPTQTASEPTKTAPKPTETTPKPTQTAPKS